MTKHKAIWIEFIMQNNGIVIRQLHIRNMLTPNNIVS